jgi:hypothetical protein
MSHADAARPMPAQEPRRNRSAQSERSYDGRGSLTKPPLSSGGGSAGRSSHASQAHRCTFRLLATQAGGLFHLIGRG